MATLTATEQPDRLSSDKTEVGSAIASPPEKPTLVEDPIADEKAQQSQDENPEYPHGLKLVLIISALCLAVFLVALDQTIIAPALGAITAQFQSVKDIVCFFCLSFYVEKSFYGSFLFGPRDAGQANTEIGLVWKCISSYDDGFAAHVWRCVQVVQRQVGLSVCCVYLRGG